MRGIPWNTVRHRNPLAMDPSVYLIESAQMTPTQARVWLQEDCSALLQIQAPVFFIQSAWLDTWLAGLPDDFQLIVLCATLESPGNSWHQQICAAAVFGIHQQQAFLHRSGIAEHDQIWVEYNRFIAHPMLPSDVAPAMLKSMLSFYPLTAIHFAMAEVTPELTSLMKACTEFSILDISHQERGWYVPLQQISYDLHFRRSLRRSLKSTDNFAKTNHWELRCCAQDDAWSTLSKVAHFHIDKWKLTETPSGFLNPEFTRFHQHFLSQQQGLVFSLHQDDQLIGAVYVLKAGRKLGFYLGCYDPRIPPRAQLGLWAHAQILRWAEQHGFTEYDFMAGEARYKSDFTPHTRLFIAFSLYRDTVKHRVWLFLKNLSHQIKKLSRSWQHIRTLP